MISFSELVQTTVTSVIAFIATNVDDLFILMMLFVNVSRRLTNRDIYAGQFLGVIALIILSLSGFLIGLIVPLPYIGLLGVFPIYLGIKEFFEKDDDDELAEEFTASNPSNTFISASALHVAGITIANGGDNVGVYIPLFVSQRLDSLIIMITIFLIMTYGWLWVSKYLANHKLVAERLRRYNHILFPALLILLGIYIMWECRTHTLIWKG
jgi:cadmium resistance transport/sequestration family protein